MKKRSYIWRFLKDLLLADLLATGAYVALLMLLNLVSEGRLVMSTGALTGQGWDAADVAPAWRVALTVCGRVFDAATLLAVLAILWWRLRRDAGRRADFLAAIGTSPFDAVAFRRTYIRGEGTRATAVYAAVLLALCLAEALGVPFATLPIVPQTLLCKALVALTPLSGGLRQTVVCVAVVAVNAALYGAYQALVVPRVYARWAGERLRVER